VLSAMRMAYYLSKERRPNADFDELLVFQGLQVTRLSLLIFIQFCVHDLTVKLTLSYQCNLGRK